MDLYRDPLGSLAGTLAQLKPDHIVVTAGVNDPFYGGDPTDWYERHFALNTIGPMRLLQAWQNVLKGEQGYAGVHHYVAISSNSARVPRSNSAAYCASKAALSQALRVKAREVGPDGNLAVYGYEPGLLAGTPMTKDTELRWQGMPLTRMRDPLLSRGIPPLSMAQMVVQGLFLGTEMNGLLIPLDADER